MNDFLTNQNKSIVKFACNRMLTDKFALNLSDEKINDLIEKVSHLVENEFKNSNLSVTELNTITLSKIKNIYQKFREKEKHNLINSQNLNSLQNQVLVDTDTKNEVIDSSSVEHSTTSPELLDDNVINFRLKELEKQRSITPVYYEKNANSTQPLTGNEVSYTNTPSLSFTLQPNITKQSLRKTFIINTASRDWKNLPIVNDMKTVVSLSPNEYLLFPEVLILPSFVSNMTPFVRLQISNGNMKINYIFTLLQQSTKWDKWSTCINVENIMIDSPNWCIELYDLFDNKLNLGSDDVAIEEVEQLQDGFKLKMNVSGFHKGDVIHICTRRISIICEYITHVDVENSCLNITNQSNSKIDHFINSIAMNTNNQYSLLISYTANV
jgi:hypothetical protein